MSIDYDKVYACKGCPCVNVDAVFAITHGGRPSSKCNLGKWDSADDSTEPPMICAEGELAKALPSASEEQIQIAESALNGHCSPSGPASVVRRYWSVWTEREKVES